MTDEGRIKFLEAALAGEDKVTPDQFHKRLQAAASKLNDLQEELMFLAESFRQLVVEEELYADLETIADDARAVEDIVRAADVIRKEYATGRKRDAIKRILNIVFCTNMLQKGLMELETNNYKFTCDAQVTPYIPKKGTPEFDALVDVLNAEWPSAVELTVNFREVQKWAKNYLENGQQPPVKVSTVPTIKVRRKGK